MKRTCKIIIDTQGNDYSKFPLEKAKSNAFVGIVENNKHIKPSLIVTEQQ
ncbi:MAG: hypothetical protein U9Q83_05330 [Bacteroidota bacterium]|nr:hypothetical protein [Bacteroidota bacterium]